MKKLLFALGLVLVFASCSSAPEKVARKFSESLAKGDIDEAKKYATKSTEKLLSMAAMFGTAPIDPDFKFIMKKDSVVGNTAWITYENQTGKAKTLKLVKIDGKWFVHIENKK